MNRRIALCLTLAALAAPAAAGGPIPWGGVGWYVKIQAGYQGAQPYAVSGPFANRADCESVVAQRRNEYPNSTSTYWCNYETVAWATPVYDDEDW